MDFMQYCDKLVDKYIEAPQRARNKVPVNQRLNYSDAHVENNTKLILAVILLFAATLLSWAVGLTDEGGLIVSFGLSVTLFPLIYQYKRRYCKSCRAKMIRQQHDGHMYYFCDNCKIKFDTGMGTDSGA